MIKLIMHFPPALSRRALAFSLITAGAFTLAPASQAQRIGPSGQQDAATSQWHKLTNQPPFPSDTALLLTDGTVAMHQYSSPNWWRLTPDVNGSYLNGTWSQLASMQSKYAPLYFASAVLPDGRMLVEGGEYNNLQQVETNLGAIYDPVANSWQPVSPPAGWTTIGDAPCVVQKDGTFMLGQAGQYTTNQVIFDASNLTWTAVGTGKNDPFVEEGFAILPDGTILTVDCSKPPSSERYNPTTKAWTSAGSTGVTLPAPGFLEIGPLIQRPDGTVVAFGGLPHNSIYNTATGTWTPTADTPSGDDCADAPAALLPDGNILVYTSPGVFKGSGTLYIFDGTAFTVAPATAASGSLQSWQARMLVLPTGEILWAPADGSTTDTELFSMKGKASRSWAPTITNSPRNVTRGSTYKISGTQFNGLSVGADYGDDGTMATNYPIVRITNTATGHVFYARTHDHSTMGIATGSAIVSTMVDIPATMETGPSSIEVVANGIPSRPKRVTVN